jgi:hypothetical protein
LAVYIFPAAAAVALPTPTSSSQPSAPSWLDGNNSSAVVGRRAARATTRGGEDVWLSGLPSSCNGDRYNGLWTKSGTTADTRGWYTHTSTDGGADHVKYLFYDADCDGKGKHPPRWIINDSKPNTTAHHDLDGDGDCRYFARTLESTNSTIPPSGDWRASCDHVWTNLPLTIEPVPVGPCDPPTSGKDAATGWCVCATDSFCADGSVAGDACDPSSPRDRWNPEKVSVA